MDKDKREKLKAGGWVVGSTNDFLRIKHKGGLEEDIFSGWRKWLCYCLRPGVAKKAKTSYNRRLRRTMKRGDDLYDR